MTKQQVVMQREHVRLQRLVADSHFQQFCLAWAQEAGVPIPRGTNPGVYVLTELYKADPGTALGVLNRCIAEQERVHGTVSDADVAAVVAAQRPGGIDWGAEFPDSKVLKAWQDLPAHSRLRETAKSAQFEALARNSFAKAGVVPFRGMTEGETFAALLVYAGRTKALSSGDRAAYDSLAQHLGGVLGDGEAIRHLVNKVKQIGVDDHVLHRIAEKTRAAETEAAKHRPKPAPQPTFDKKFTPQSAAQVKQRPADPTYDDVRRQVARQRAGWELPGRRRPEKLRTESNDPLHLAVSMALLKSKGESYDRLRIGPGLWKQGVQQLRDKGIEPALASRSSGNSSERHWVPAPTNPASGSTSSGGYSGGGESTGGDAGAQTGSGT